MTTMVEPEWDEQTRNLVLGHAAVELCGICGGPAYLCQDPQLQESWRVGKPIRCHRRTAVLEHQARLDPRDSPNAQALLWPIELIGKEG